MFHSGAFESGGTYHFGGFYLEVIDVQVVVAYLKREFGYVVDLVVGHSRGVVVGLLWMCSSEEGKAVRGFVNVSGRYRMHVSLRADIDIRCSKFIAGIESLRLIFSLHTLKMKTLTIMT